MVDCCTIEQLDVESDRSVVRACDAGAKSTYCSRDAASESAAALALLLIAGAPARAALRQQHDTSS